MTATHVPNNLLVHRQNARLLQSDVARCLGISGTERISRWERGLAVPSLVNLFKLALLYGVAPQALYSELFRKLQDGSGKAMQHPSDVSNEEIEP